MHRVVKFFQKIDLQQFLIWCECLLCVVLVLYIFRKVFPSKKIIDNNKKNGTISISGNALNDAIIILAKQCGLHGRIKLNCRSKKLIVNMKVHESDKYNISNISGITHHKLHVIFLKSVGIDVENEVNVIISGFSFEKITRVLANYPDEDGNHALLRSMDNTCCDSYSSFSTGTKSMTDNQKSKIYLHKICHYSQNADLV